MSLEDVGTLNLDGTVTYWSVYEQRWVEHVASIPAREYAAMGTHERERMRRHLYAGRPHSMLEHAPAELRTSIEARFDKPGTRKLVREVWELLDGKDPVDSLADLDAVRELVALVLDDVEVRHGARRKDGEGT